MTIFFEKLLKEYAKDTSKSILDLFAQRFKSSSYTGIKFVYASDRNQFKSSCIEIIKNLDEFLSNYSLTNIMDQYEYRSKIKGHIGGRLKDHNINIYF